jgi:hypothetical protein
MVEVKPPPKKRLAAGSQYWGSSTKTVGVRVATRKLISRKSVVMKIAPAGSHRGRDWDVEFTSNFTGQG